MRKIREVIRLWHGLKASDREIALSVGIARSTVGEFVHRSEAAGLTWPLPEHLSDEDLEHYSTSKVEHYSVGANTGNEAKPNRDGARRSRRRSAGPRARPRSRLQD